ncbi:unnamed protein product [Dicrocoelium dendriticum]|nr:unnamed protein product [Dicrocoelium dendriticum]
MQHLYPNFYSLMSAPSQPLDPRFRRRSLIWNSTNGSSDGLPMGYFIWTPLPDSKRTNPNALSLPARRRCASQTPMRNSSNNHEFTASMAQSFRRSQSDSPSDESTPPPPPLFADETTEEPRRDETLTTSAIEVSQTQTNDMHYLFPARTGCGENSSTVHRSDPQCVGIRVQKSLPSREAHDRRRGQVVRSTSTYKPLTHWGQAPNSKQAVTQIQPASSLQDIDNLNLHTPHFSAGVSRGPRVKLVMGLRHLNHGNRSGLRMDGELLTPVEYLCHPATPAPVYHSRMNSVPLSNPRSGNFQATAMCQLPTVTTSFHLAKDHKSRLADKPCTYRGSTVLAESCVPDPKACQPLTPMMVHSAKVVASAVSKSSIQTKNFLDTGGLLTTSSDSGVDLSDTSGANGFSGPLGTFPVERTGPITRRRTHVNPKRAQVVSAFEQSLNSMSQRLQTLTHTTAKKDSELHTLRSTIEALRTQSGLGFSKLLHAKVGRSLEEKSDEKYPETEQASHPISGTSSLSLNQQDVASSGRLSPVNQSSYSAESSPKKTPLTDTKSIPVIGLKKNSWFRASIGKAFRKRSPATSSVNCVTSPASPQQTHGSVDAQIPSDHLHSVTGVGTMCSRFPLEATTPNQWSKPDPTPIMGQPIGRLNGLSPSVSSTSSSSTSGSRWNHEVNAAVWPTNNACSSYCSTDPHPSHADVATHLGTFPPSKSVSCRNSRAGAQSAVVAPTEHSFGAEALRKPTTSGVSFAPSKKVNNIPMTANFSPYPSQLHALESEVCRLRGQLSERESKLTDVQLEALASTHQVNQLRDQLLRMEEELQRLRSDNHRLQSLVRGGTDTPAAISTQPASRLENDVDPSKLTPLPCVSDENNEWPVESELDILFAVSHKSGKNPDEFQTKRLAVVSLVPDAEAELRSINIGLVDLKQFAHWVDLDKHLTQMFVAYTRLINPHGELDTRINTILGYRIVTHSTPQNGDVYEHWIRSGESVGNSEEETALATLLKQNSIENGTTQIALLFRADSNGFSVRLPLFFLLPAARLECCLSLLHRYRRIVLCHSNEFAAQTEMLAFSLARCLQESGRVAECHRFHLGRSNDPVGEAERCVSSTNTNKPVAIVLHQLDCITSQQFINMLRSSTDQMAASFNGEGHFLIGTVLESISPPDEAELLPVDSCLVRWNTNSCCWISSQWKEFDVCKLYLSCSLRQRIVHLAVAESSDLKECDTLRFSHTSPIRAHLEWLQKVWEKIRQQHTNAILPPNVFDDVPLSDLEQWFIYKWNNQIARHLRAETKDGSCAGELIDWICSTWPTKEGREKLRQQLTPSQT